MSGRFNPDALTVEHATPYQQAHEWAHLEQQARATLAWRMRRAALCIPFVERLTNLLVECEAAALALAEMRACGIWEAQDRAEAMAGLASYGRSLISPRMWIFLANLRAVIKRA